MKHAVFSALLIGCLSWGCDDKDKSENQGGSSSTAGAGPSAGSSGTSDQSGSGGRADSSAGSANGGDSNAGGSHSAGSSSSGGSSNGGSSSGGSSNGGSSNGGSSSGGKGPGNAGAGGKAQWPTWVPQCTAIRGSLCGNCATPECLVCIYGTDEELASTGVTCDKGEQQYKEYCTCVVTGCPVPCRY